MTWCTYWIKSVGDRKNKKRPTFFTVVWWNACWLTSKLGRKWRIPAKQGSIKLCYQILVNFITFQICIDSPISYGTTLLPLILVVSFSISKQVTHTQAVTKHPVIIQQILSSQSKISAPVSNNNPNARNIERTWIYFLKPSYCSSKSQQLALDVCRKGTHVRSIKLYKGSMLMCMHSSDTKPFHPETMSLCIK